MEENNEKEIKSEEVTEKLLPDEENVIEQEGKKDKVDNVKRKKGLWKILIIVIIMAIIVGAIVWFVITSKGEKGIIQGTDMQINTTRDQILYDTEEELLQYLGEEYAYYYTFAVIEKDSSEYEIYGTLIDKSEIGEEYDINSLVKTDRDYVASILGEENTSQVSDLKLGEKDFKTYNYKDSDETSDKYMVAIYVADIGDKYLLIEFYANVDFEATRVNDIMNKLFK